MKAYSYWKSARSSRWWVHLTIAGLGVLAVTVSGCSAKVEEPKDDSGYVCTCTFDYKKAGDSQCPPWASECCYKDASGHCE